MEALRLEFLEQSETESQYDFIKRVIDTQGFASRNFCLKRYITRLADLIFKLKKRGYDLKGEPGISGDFIYRRVL
jgi:hypothetical protein